MFELVSEREQLGSLVLSHARQTTTMGRKKNQTAHPKTKTDVSLLAGAATYEVGMPRVRPHLSELSTHPEGRLRGVRSLGRVTGHLSCLWQPHSARPALWRAAPLPRLDLPLLPPMVRRLQPPAAFKAGPHNQQCQCTAHASFR